MNSTGLKQAAKRLPVLSQLATARGWWRDTRGVCTTPGRLRLSWAATLPRLSTQIISAHLIETDSTVFLRPRSSDLSVFAQVIVERQYDLEYGLSSPKLVIDAGANVGFAAVFFAHTYPTAKIICLEPGIENFRASREKRAPVRARRSHQGSALA